MMLMPLPLIVDAIHVVDVDVLDVLNVIDDIDDIDVLDIVDMIDVADAVDAVNAVFCCCWTTYNKAKHDTRHGPAECPKRFNPPPPKGSENDQRVFNFFRNL